MGFFAINSVGVLSPANDERNPRESRLGPSSSKELVDAAIGVSGGGGVDNFSGILTG